MSATAQVWNAQKEQWELVRADRLCDEDRRYRFRCASCHASAILVVCTEKENYFRSHEHAVDCPEAKGHKLLRINTRTEIDLDAILTHVDRDIPQRKTDSPEDELDQPELSPDDEETSNADLRLDPNATHSIRSASGMYRELLEKHGDEYLDSFATREVNSIFFRRDTFLQFKRCWGSPVKLVVTKRCVPQKLKYKIPSPEGYVILRDAYSHNDDEAIYFLVRLVHPDHNKRFKERLFGRIERDESGQEKRGIGRDSHRNIVIFASWTKVPHTHYQVYRAELNSRMVAFVNAPDAQ